MIESRESLFLRVMFRRLEDTSVVDGGPEIFHCDWLCEIVGGAVV